MAYFEHRVFFLREFTQELITHSKKEIHLILSEHKTTDEENYPEKTQEEKMSGMAVGLAYQTKKQEENKPKDSIDEYKPDIKTHKLSKEDLLDKRIVERLRRAKPEFFDEGLDVIASQDYKRRSFELGEELPPSFKKKTFEIGEEIPPPYRPQTPQPMPATKPQTQKFPSNIAKEMPSMMTREQVRTTIQSITPEPQPLPQGFTLGKLDQLVHDPTVTSMECPGPGKFVIVKRAGRINITKINLSEKDIREVVQYFSQQTKIPVIEGIFKAAVGNLVITALISDFVGSRFMINKYVPYSVIQPDFRQQ